MTTKITIATLMFAVLGGALATVAEAHKFAPPPPGLRPPAREATHACDGTTSCLPNVLFCRPITKFGPCPPPR